MESHTFKILIRKFKDNLLMKRKQFSIVIFHKKFSSISKKEIQKKIADIYKIKDSSVIFLFGFKTEFGGNVSTGFGFVYYNLEAARKFEPKYRLLRNGLLQINPLSSKRRKEQKNKKKSTRGRRNSNV
nr:40S ribosomal protein S24 [Cryptomonas paramecium]